MTYSNTDQLNNIFIEYGFLLTNESIIEILI